MLSQGYRRSDIDHCLYTKRAKDGSLLILILYVDDMLIASKNKDEIDASKKNLHDNFHMKNLGNATHILGIQIVRAQDKKLLYLSQNEYINKVHKLFNMIWVKALNTQLPSYLETQLVRLSQICGDDNAAMAKVAYSSTIGSFMYAMIATHLEIAFVVGVVSHYMSNHGKILGSNERCHAVFAQL